MLCESYILEQTHKYAKDGKVVPLLRKERPIMRRIFIGAWPFLAEDSPVFNNGRECNYLDHLGDKPFTWKSFKNWLENGHPLGKIVLCDGTISVSALRNEELYELDIDLEFTCDKCKHAHYPELTTLLPINRNYRLNLDGIVNIIKSGVIGINNITSIQREQLRQKWKENNKSFLGRLC